MHLKKLKLLLLYTFYQSIHYKNVHKNDKNPDLNKLCVIKSNIHLLFQLHIHYLIQI